MLIMGVDPGTAITGYGIIEAGANTYKPVDYDCIRTDSKQEPELRLAKIYERLMNVMQQWPIDTVAVEQLFFNKDTQTALAVGQARGTVLLASAHCYIPVAEYTPLQLKQALVGYGRASKIQVQEMVRVLLCLEKVPRPDDAADALGLAICHAQTSKFDMVVQKKG